MRKNLQRIGRLLKSSRGDSIAEVLIALLISAVALVMLASMISSSTSMTDSSKKKIENYYVSTNSLIGNGKSAGTGTVNLVVSGESTVKTSFSVDYYVNNEINKHPVITFEKTNPNP